jgi:hypothetical protein
LNVEKPFPSDTIKVEQKLSHTSANELEEHKSALKIISIEDHRAFVTTLPFSALRDFHEQQKDKLNLKDCSTFYGLIVSCSANVIISRSEHSLDEKSYCEVDLQARKVDFFYCPIAGIKSTLISVSLDTELPPSKAYVTLVRDLNEFAKETERLSIKHKTQLDESARMSEETMNKYEELVNKVEIRETQIFMQFVLLLNEKKKKIRELTDELKELKELKNQ